MSIKVQLLICRSEQIKEAEREILLLGKRFANQYSLSAPTEILRGASGKPYFADSELFFSVSHSGSYWACAVGNGELGIDLQRYQACHVERIAKRFFHPREAAWIDGKGQEGFFLVWTAKESYVKFTGEGITDRFAAFSVVDEQGKIDCCQQARLRHIPFAEDYALCVCTAAPAEIEMI